MTLALDIIENEQEHNLEFSHIFIEAGTGLSAQALISGFAFLKKNTHIHVLVACSNSHSFEEDLHNKYLQVHTLFDYEMLAYNNYTLHRPTTAKAFGSTNKKIFFSIQEIARTEGLLLDPVWSCKLFLLLQDQIETKTITGPTLFIHSGGGTSLFGYQKELQKLI